SLRSNERRKAPVQITFARRLNLDDFGAEPGQEQGTIRPGQIAGQIQHDNSRERFLHHAVSFLTPVHARVWPGCIRQAGFRSTKLCGTLEGRSVYESAASTPQDSG